MKALEEKIVKEGIVLPGNILKVGSFLNQQLDVDFLMEMGREIAHLYDGCGATKLLTIEASGIALAVAAGASMHLPAVFAKKHRSGNVSGEVYTATVYSYTHKTENAIMVAKEYLAPGDKVLIIDDFLATGEAIAGLRDIISQAGATLVGVAAGIEKGFQGGGDKFRAQGIRVESLAIVDSMEDGRLVFRPQSLSV